MPRPNIFQYGDYRKFLTDMIEHLRSINQYSNESFAKKTGLKSKNHLRLIIQGKRGLTDKSITKIGLGLGLNKLEFSYFEALVRYDQVKDYEHKLKIAEGLKKIRGKEKVRELSEDDAIIFSKWYIVVLYEAIRSTPELSKSDFLKHLKITPKEYQEAIDILKGRGLIEGKSEPFFPTSKSVETSIEVEDIYMPDFHRQMISRAQSSIKELQPRDRQISSLTLSIPRSEMPEVRRRVFEFIRDINAIYESQTDNRKKEDPVVCQLNVQLFPIFDPRSTH